MLCNACGHDNPDDARFCQSCGSPLDAPSRSTKFDHQDAYRSYDQPGHSGYESYAAPRSLTSTLVWSILATIFCCQPVGIVAIVFAALAMSAEGQSNYALANKHATTARTWAWVSFGLGISVIVIYGVIGFVGAAAGP